MLQNALECDLCGTPSEQSPCRYCKRHLKTRRQQFRQNGRNRILEAHQLIKNGDIDPEQPCPHLSGSVEKVAWLAVRYERGLKLFHPLDRTGTEPCQPETRAIPLNWWLDLESYEAT